MSGTLTLYERLTRFPIGNILFNRALAFRVPYVSTIHPHVTDLRSGYCRIEIKDRRSIRNHLGKHQCRCSLHSGGADGGTRGRSNNSLKSKIYYERDDSPVHQESKRQSGWKMFR
jgi:hypothetical protein